MNINAILEWLFFAFAVGLYILGFQDSFEYWAFLSLFNLGVAIYLKRK